GGAAAGRALDRLFGGGGPPRPRSDRSLRRLGLLGEAEGNLTPGTAAVTASFGSNRSAFDEDLFVLAFARDLSGAHRAQPQGHRAREGHRGEPNEGPAARSRVPRRQSDDGDTGAGRRRRAGDDRVA